MSKVSENIKKFRLEKDMKQSELARALGKSDGVISNWEKEINHPDVDSIAKMCEIFEVDANTFFGWDNEITDQNSKNDNSEDLTNINPYNLLKEEGGLVIHDGKTYDFSDLNDGNKRILLALFEFLKAEQIRKG